MSESTRRTFLLASGAGAAAVGLAAAGPASAAPAAAPATLPPDVTDLMVHIADPRSGTLTLLVGEREVVVHDRDLVARLARHASREA